MTPVRENSDSMKIYINGKLYSKGDAKISVFDHGVLYGDGVFEGIRVYNGRVFKLAEHMDRLYESAKTIMLDIPLPKKNLTKDVIEIVRLNGLKNAYVRLIVTRGAGSLGLNPFTCKNPQVIIIVDKIILYPPKFYKEGLTVITVGTQRNIAEAVSPRVKSLNYLNNILAKIEALNSGVPEAIMLNSFGFVSECTGDNIFTVKKGSIFTPSIYMGVLEGITRACVIDISRAAGIPVKPIVMTRHDIYNSDECFLTGTAAEIVPVVRADGRNIGAGKPGQVTRFLMKEFRRLARREGVPAF